MDADTTPETAGTLYARCRADTADILRRGAWYPVLQRTSGGGLIVDLGDRHLFMTESQVHLRTTPPDHWCLVRRSDLFRDRRPEGGAVPDRYVVCPSCRHRQALEEGRPAELACEHCRTTSPVDWDTDG